MSCGGHVLFRETEEAELRILRVRGLASPSQWVLVFAALMFFSPVSVDFSVRQVGCKSCEDIVLRASLGSAGGDRCRVLYTTLPWNQWTLKRDGHRRLSGLHSLMCLVLSRNTPSLAAAIPLSRHTVAGDFELDSHSPLL